MSLRGGRLRTWSGPGKRRRSYSRRRRSVIRRDHSAKRAHIVGARRRGIMTVMDRRRFRLGFAGFGNVGRALARLLIDRRDELRRRYGLSFEVTLLASARRGALIDPKGIDLD